MWLAVQMSHFSQADEPVQSEEVALTVNVQSGSAGHDPGLVLGWHCVPPGVFLCGPLNEQADVAMTILVHAGEKEKVVRVLNV